MNTIIPTYKQTVTVASIQEAISACSELSSENGRTISTKIISNADALPNNNMIKFCNQLGCGFQTEISVGNYKQIAGKQFYVIDTDQFGNIIIPGTDIVVPSNCATLGLEKVA